MSEVVAHVALLSGIALPQGDSVGYSHHRRKPVIALGSPSRVLLVLGPHRISPLSGFVLWLSYSQRSAMWYTPPGPPLDPCSLWIR